MAPPSGDQICTFQVIEAMPGSVVPLAMFSYLDMENPTQMHFIYSLVHLVLPNTEELISQSIEDPVDAPGHCKPQVP